MDRTPKDFRCCIVGAGPAGLMAAIAAVEAGARRVEVLEALPAPGRRLLATGGGRCNLAHDAAPEEVMARFGRRGRFMAAALYSLPVELLRERFAEWGVPTIVEDDGRIFPAGHRAADVLEALLRRAAALGVTVRTNTPAESLQLQDGAVVGVVATGRSLPADRVLLACGGKSYPELGGSGVGYRLANQAGHSIVSATPALVALEVRESWAKSLAGVGVPDAAVRMAGPGKTRSVRGPVLFTHRGVSGPAVLDISADVTEALRAESEVELRIRFTPDSREDWAARLEQWRANKGRKTLTALLKRHIPESVSLMILKLANVDESISPSQITTSQREALLDGLTDVPLAVVGTEGFGRAMLTRGGVELREIDATTLHSRRVDGVYLAGELLDLDGPTGGYNLHWAFASGHLAGLAMAESLRASG
jgi:hypothetical protein